MEERVILDCTLRDGGYCNNWEFGVSNIVEIIENLVAAGIEIIECGFLTEKTAYKEGNTKFNKIEQIEEYVPKKKSTVKFIAMINHGEYDVSHLPTYQGGKITGIRYAFHKENMEEALCECKRIKEKGYKVFIQPMVTINYSEIEFIEIIEKCNMIQPYAFYIVDSFGTMDGKQVSKYLQLTAQRLNESIKVGYHSHNNLQLALANATTVLEKPMKNGRIIDACIFGMGRGAGNLSTELAVQFVNQYEKEKYNIIPILNSIDSVIYNFYSVKNWGYQIPYYLSARYNIHPNYAKYLMAKNKLSFEEMDLIISSISEQKRVRYDSIYIEGLYFEFLSKKIGL